MGQSVIKNPRKVYSQQGGGGSSGVAWGNITGTLSNQTDLEAVLSSQRVFLNGGHTTSNPADATTYVFGALPLPLTGTGSSGGNVRIYFPITGTLVYARITFVQTAGSNQTSTIYLRLNNTTDTILSSAVTNDASVTTFVNSSLSISGSTTDYVEFKWVCPTWTTNPTGVFASWELGFKL